MQDLINNFEDSFIDLECAQKQGTQLFTTAKHF